MFSLITFLIFLTQLLFIILRFNCWKPTGNISWHTKYSKVKRHGMSVMKKCVQSSSSLWTHFNNWKGLQKRHLNCKNIYRDSVNHCQMLCSSFVYCKKHSLKIIKSINRYYSYDNKNFLSFNKVNTRNWRTYIYMLILCTYEFQIWATYDYDWILSQSKRDVFIKSETFWKYKNAFATYVFSRNIISGLSRYKTQTGETATFTCVCSSTATSITKHASKLVRSFYRNWLFSEYELR